MTENILIVAAHPDDEILGVGGTIARHAAAGDRVHILILAQGAASREKENTQDQILALKETARKAAITLGAQQPHFTDFPDNAMDTVDLLDIVKAIEAVVDEIAPGTVYTHHGGDLNIDHRITFEAVLTACRPVPGNSVRQIYTFETVSSTEWGIGPAFKPTRFVAISDHIETKMDALKLYEMEMRPFPHVRSFEAVRNQARLRGASVGLEAAEAFEVIREIITPC